MTSEFLDTRYVQHRPGYGYYYNPPKAALEAGVFKGINRRLGDDRADAARLADKYNQLLDRWRANGMKLPRASSKFTQHSFEALCRKFYDSSFYLRNAEETQKQYKICLDNICGTEIVDNKKTKLFGELLLIELNREHCYELYEEIKDERGPAAAHLAKRLLHRVLFLASKEWTKTFGIQYNVAERLDVASCAAREVVWEPGEISLFVKHADEAGFLSISGIVLGCYELMQRHKDLRLLRKASFRKTNTGPEAWFTQTKRGQKIWITIPDTLATRMEASIQAHPNSEVVFPCEMTGEPWQRNTFAKKAREIMTSAGLSSHLQIRDIRRTAATEGGAAGLTEDELMAQGGWKSRQSVVPYVQKTRAAAASGQEKRRKYRDGG